MNKRYAVLSYLLVVCTLISSFSLPIFAQEVEEIVEEETLGSIDAGTMPGAGEVDPLAYPDPPYEASILDGAICGFKNKASARFLTIDTGNTASGTNVYQYKNVDTVYPNAQVFKIQYLTNSGTYYIIPLDTSGQIAQTRLKYSPSAATSGTASNLQLMYMMPTENTDQWLIQPVGDGSYFKIVSKANQSLCITSYGTSNGTASGTGTSSAGNVYVSTYTGSDNQLWEIYSGWQPVSVYGSDIKATLSDAGHIDEGTTPNADDSFYCVVDTYGDKASSWTSSNTTVATVDSLGRITAKKAGQVTISRTVTHADGTTNTYSKSFYVTIPTGVYKIYNAYSGKCLDVSNSCGLDGTDVVQYTGYSTNLNQMWKVTYLDYGKYSLRPLNMITSGMYLMSTSKNVVISNIGDEDGYSRVLSWARWYIEYTSNGYIFKMDSTGSDVMQISQFSTANSITVNMGKYQSGDTRFCWNFTLQANPPTGIGFYDTETGQLLSNPTVSMPNRKTFSNYMAVPYGNLSSYNVTYSSSNTNVATVNPSDGKVVAVGEGTVKITAQKDSLKTDYTISVYIAEGLYLFKNRETSKYMQPDNNGNSHMEHHDFNHDTTVQRWKLIYHGELYYKIQNVNNGLYLTAPNNTTDGASVTQQAYASSTSSRQLWKITKLSSGAYEIKAKSHEGTSLVLAVGWGADWNGTNIEQRNASTSTNKDEWYLPGINYSYVNYYDESIPGNTELIKKIEATNEFSNYVYSSLYNIGFTMDGDATHYSNAYADQCTTGINSPCNNSCSTNCSNHHKNGSRISDQLYYASREDDHIYVMWSNRAANTYCLDDKTTGQHSTQQVKAMVLNHRPVINIYQIDGAVTRQEGVMAIMLAHETAHTFGLDDVYNDPSHSVNEDCIMDQYYSDSATNEFYNKIKEYRANPFCSSCTETLQALAMSKVISGN